MTNLQVPTGLGSTTPAVYTAWKMPCKLTLLVISLIRTGATRLERSFLWTQRKLISTIFFSLEQKKRKKKDFKQNILDNFSCLNSPTTHSDKNGRCDRNIDIHSGQDFISLHIVDANVGWNGADESHKLLVGVHPHTTMPLWQPAWRSQRPEKHSSQSPSQNVHLLFVINTPIFKIMLDLF